ncbi:Leu/Phe/Val dehydrogenase [Sphingomonas montana]|uniref:Leu/Phe/Val dehydrogenase n=1 Tax=Sphingomonas montana TaxID=1843236 RepID=UPI00096E445E|nr:Glu/Leu/Phe/Val dehydrogenase dimerization domain-containing protein [Sphingomonas montana]
MTAPWDYLDYDDHEGLHFFRDRASGLTAVIAIHSTTLGPAAGGTRYWQYDDPELAVTDVLRLSRGMSYKNAMAGLPLGGGKAVILADGAAGAGKSPELLAAFGRAVDSLDGRYVTAEDVGISLADMVAVRGQTRFVSGLPAEGGAAGGDPGPFTAQGIFLGIEAAVRRRLKRDLDGVHVAIQGVGSVGGGLARRLAARGAKLTLADVDAGRAARLADELGGRTVAAADILRVEADVVSPNALGAILDDATIAALSAPIVAGGANNQLATPADGTRLQARGILYAPDYVINAGGIISVGVEYLGQGDRDAVEARIAHIPDRLNAIWDESDASGDSAAAVSDRMAQRLIGR